MWAVWKIQTARWHVGTKGCLQPFFNISRFFGKTLAGVMNFLYLCNVKKSDENTALSGLKLRKLNLEITRINDSKFFL